MNKPGHGRSRRGEPLVMLGLVLAGWIVVRTVVLDDGRRSHGLSAMPTVQHAVPDHGLPGVGKHSGVRLLSLANPRAAAPMPRDAVLPPSPAAIGNVSPTVAPPRHARRALMMADLDEVAVPPGLQQPGQGRGCRTHTAAAALRVATGGGGAAPGVSLPMRAALSPQRGNATQGTAGPIDEPTRWSGDGWLLLRDGGSAVALAAGAAGYGGSQAGAVVRYRLAGESALRPTAYVRLAGALGGVAIDKQAALGLSVRPLPRLPVALLVEGRVQQSDSGTRLRPAVALVSELPPQRLPLGVDAEFYGQVGWVGASAATGFFDAQLTADRPVGPIAPGMELRAGAGVWSGGQRGAARLDVGPRLALRMNLGAVSARLALDWRLRVAGQALPGSGPALTLAAGF